MIGIAVAVDGGVEITHLHAQGSSRGRRCRFSFRAPLRWLKYFETDACSDTEYLLRIIPADFYKRELTPPIQRPAFAPSPKDDDGLSFFREDFVSPRKLAKWYRNKKGGVIARIRVSELRAMQLSVVVNVREDSAAGYVLVPEISIHNRSAKGKVSLQLELAKKCSEEAFIAKNCPSVLTILVAPFRVSHRS